MRILWVLIAVGLAFGGWKIYEHLETEKATESAVSNVAPLVEYRELYESGRDREANDVLLMTVAALVEAENAGVDLREVLRRAELVNNTPVNYSDLLTESLLRNVKIARELELDAAENLARMTEARVRLSGPDHTRARRPRWTTSCRRPLLPISTTFLSIWNSCPAL